MIEGACVDDGGEGEAREDDWDKRRVDDICNGELIKDGRLVLRLGVAPLESGDLRDDEAEDEVGHGGDGGGGEGDEMAEDGGGALDVALFVELLPDAQRDD